MPNFLNFVDIYIGMHAVVFMTSGLAGIVGHFISKRLKGEIDKNLFQYVIDNPGSSAAVVLSLIAATFAANAVGALEELKMSAAVAAGFTSGWTIDSVKGRPEPAPTEEYKP